MRLNCSTCYELITPDDDLTCLTCGHIFHNECVLKWFENKNNCPQCRHPANKKSLRKIFLTVEDNEDTSISPEDLQIRLDNALLANRTLKIENKNISEKFYKIKETILNLKEELKSALTKNKSLKDQRDFYKVQVTNMAEIQETMQRMKQERDVCKKELERFKSVEVALRMSESEVNLMLHERGAYDERTRDLCLIIVELKKALMEVKRQRTNMESKCTTIREEKDAVLKEKMVLSRKLSLLQESKRNLESERECLTEENEKLCRLLNPKKSSTPDDSHRVETDSSHDSDQRKAHEDLESGHANSSSPITVAPQLSKSEDNIQTVTNPNFRKRKPLSRIIDDKRPRVVVGSSLYETLGKTSFQVNYDCYGNFGRFSSSDEFPSQRPKLLPSKTTLKKKDKPRQESKISKSRLQQSQTIDRFFGKFDTP